MKELLTITWIKVEESLPEDCNKVYFQTKEGEIYCGEYYHNYFSYPGIAVYDPWDSYNKMSVEYWAYLPEIKGVQ